MLIPVPITFSGRLASGNVGWPHHASGAVRSGHLSVTETPDGTKFLRDDFTWRNVGSVSLMSGSVMSGHIASGAVQGFFGSTRHVASGTLGVFDFGSGAVVAGSVGSGAVASGNVASGSLGFAHLADGSVRSGTIASGQIDWVHAVSGLVSGLILSGRLGSGIVGTVHLADNSVTSGDIASGQVSQFHLASPAVFSGQLASGIVGSVHLADNAVQSGDLASGVVFRFSLASGAVNSGHLADASVVSGSVASGAVGFPHLADGSVRSGSIASGIIGTVHLADASVTSGDVASGVISRFHLASGAVNSGHIGNDAVVSGSIASGIIGTVHLADESVTSGDIASGSVSRFKVASGSFLGFELGSGAVVSGRVASGQIGFGHFANASVQSGTLASGAVGKPHIASGAIASGQLAVTETPDGTKFLRDDFSWRALAATVNSGDIGSGKIASGAVQGFFGATRHIASGTVGVSDLGSGAIVAGTVGSGAVVSGNIASGQIGTGHLANASVTSGDVASGTVSRFHLASGAVNSGHLASGSVLSELWRPGICQGRLTLASGIPDFEPVRSVIPNTTDTTADTVTFSDPHGWATGVLVKVTETQGGLTADTLYYVNVINTTTVSFYNTLANAVASGATGKVNLTADVYKAIEALGIAASGIHFTPYQGSQVSLFTSGTADLWRTRNFTQVSSSGGFSSGVGYDAFLYDDAGTFKLDYVAWTNITTRAAAFTNQNGVLVKSGTPERLFVGSFFVPRSGELEDSQRFRYVWNEYNRLDRSLSQYEPADSWTYSLGLWRVINLNSGNRIALFNGRRTESVSMEAIHLAFANPAAFPCLGVGVNWTVVNMANQSVNVGGVIDNIANMIAAYKETPREGLSAYYPLESTATSGQTINFVSMSDDSVGRSGNALLRRAGIAGMWKC